MNRSIFYRLLLGIACLLIAAQLSSQNEKLKQGWVKLDRKILSKVTKTMNVKYPTISTLILDYPSASLDTLHIDDQLSILTFKLAGGYISIYNKLLVKNDIIIQHDAIIYGDDVELLVKEKERFLFDTMQWNRDTILGYDEKMLVSLKRSVIHVKLSKKLSHNVYYHDENKLKNSLPNSLLAYYRVLIDPFVNYPYGDFCGYSSRKPLGRIAVEKLYTAGEDEAIVQVLNGLNPVGRLYALEHLYKKRLISIERLNAYKTSRIIIPICEGCFGYSSNYSDLINTIKVKYN